MNEEQSQLPAKAEENIAAAHTLMDRGFAEIGASRAYYAMFYLAAAMLLEKNKRFRKHSAVMAAFGHEITQPGILPAEVHGWLLDAAKARHTSDYRTDRPISQDEIADHIERAERFLEEVRRVLGKEPENDK